MNPDSWGNRRVYIGIAVVAGAIIVIVALLQAFSIWNLGSGQSAIDRASLNERETFLQNLSASRTTSLSPEQRVSFLQKLSEQKPISSEEERVKILESISQ